MPFIAYTDYKPRGDAALMLTRAAQICTRYAAQGYDLTLRQLYYQFVANDWIPNTEKSYKTLGRVIDNGRHGGYLDWNWLVDRGREIDQRSSWRNPRHLIEVARDQYHHTYWEGQPVHVEVWVEKQALAGVVERIARQYDVISLACKGYMSASEQHTAAMRMLAKIKEGKRVRVIHLGDHDPSGIDMTRDNYDRLSKFIGHHLGIKWGEDYYIEDGERVYDWGNFDDWHREEYFDGQSHDESDFDNIDGMHYYDGIFSVDRIALNMDQIRQYNPPPNPAKMTDSRAEEYVRMHGRSSWELDALPPEVLSNLIETAIVDYIDMDKFQARCDLEDTYKQKITDMLDAHGDMLTVPTTTTTTEED